MTIKRIKLATLAVAMSISIPSYAAIEINEEDFGPSYETMVVDSVVGKPLQLVNAVAGTAAFIVSLPFSVLGGNTHIASEKLVAEPWQAMTRCLGCTIAEDNYYKSASQEDNQIRIIVDQPSEVLINTNDDVIVIAQ